MTISPVMVKILAGLAVQTAADEQARKRLFVVILTPVLILLLLIAFIIYLLVSPLTLFMGWMFGDSEIAAIEAFQKEYGYNQNLGIFDQDYVNGSAQSYEDVMLADGGMEVMYYNQLDERWADIMYGNSSTIGQAGCGPTSMAIVISTLTGEPHDPVELARWSAANGHRCEGNGSYHSLIPAAAAAYGLNCDRNLDAQGIVDALSSGKLVVVIMSKGHFTRGGHFIVLRGVTGEGKILVADPASYGRSEQEWDLSIIMDESNKAAGSGGPYWAIGR
jgi:hypothetical protein